MNVNVELQLKKQQQQLQKKNTKKEAPEICLVFWDLYRDNLKI